MDVIRQYGEAIRKFLPRAVLLAMLGVVLLLVVLNKPAPKVPPPLKADTIDVVIEWAFQPIGDFQVTNEGHTSQYWGSFQSCYIISSLVTTEGDYSVSPFLGYEVTKLHGLHPLTSFPIFTEFQAEALAAEYGYQIKTKDGISVIEAKVSVSKELWDEFHTGFIEEVKI